jgi:DNA-binding MarR family transcriptional regulator
MVRFTSCLLLLQLRSLQLQLLYANVPGNANHDFARKRSMSDMKQRPAPAEPADDGAQPGRSPWPLFLTTHAVLVGRIEARLAEAGLPELDWYDVLWALERAPRARLRMHELAALTVISRSNLTRLVDRLEAAGLVARDRDRADRRGAYAVLTGAGRAMRRRMWKVYGEAIDALFDRHLTTAETRQLRAILLRVLKAARGENP